MPRQNRCMKSIGIEFGKSSFLEIAIYTVFRLFFCADLRVKFKLKGNSHNPIMIGQKCFELDRDTALPSLVLLDIKISEGIISLYKLFIIPEIMVNHSKLEATCVLVRGVFVEQKMTKRNN
ncbi:hypothetical protein BpHYR1_019694 [Brachionus plicatilis]|uniref:Uncharacterized protein n=1 Tax=Brachionus plicatilis TaxID=10195 RepID=A0A3M7PHY2_BRAPC|nr:hypothetical protein BpHYR1_019694 [Brachionus plicatilis]